ncbi:MAG: hypothetical protein HC850_17800 [Rhodomicrobium sp.]|nr:hypothetical protein [Rhodomicrobium sp.]
MKLPTAERSKLLGTGETDLTLRGDFVYETRSFGVFAGGGRAFTGKSELFPLQDRWQLAAGAYAPIGRRLTIGALYDWREPLVVRSGAISEVTTYVSMRVTSRLSVLGYTVAGLSDSSPDFGAGLRLSVDFDLGRPRGIE